MREGGGGWGVGEGVTTALTDSAVLPAGRVTSVAVCM